MRQIALSGANGFLGWHTRSAALGIGAIVRPISMGANFDSVAAAQAVSGSSQFIHLAGVNRGSESEVRDGNLLFARQAAESIEKADTPPSVVVFANSTQAGNGSVYGLAKSEAAEVLSSAASRAGVDFVNIALPNLFGEHGRPFYNAVTSTFSHLLAKGESPSVDGDKELTLLHAQDAADLLLGTTQHYVLSDLTNHESVSGLLKRLSGMAAIYARGEIPDVASKFDRDLFNTYRSHTFPGQAPIPLMRRADARGSFFEIIRSHGGCGQSSFSTTVPGVSRGDHFHRRKIERFTVLSGSATISLRKLFTNAVFTFDVTGDRPFAVDMPTMWAHKIINTGADVLFTSFWTNEIFDPDVPDTIAEAVSS